MIFQAELVTHHWTFLLNPLETPPDSCLPVTMHMGCAEGKAIVEKCGVNHGAVFCPFQQVSKVAEMAMTSSDSVSSTILV